MSFPRSRTAGRPSLHALSLAVLAFSCLAAQAQTSRLDTVVTTASRAPQRLADVLADVSVITRDEMDRLPAGSLADLLRQQGAVEFSRSGGPAATTSLFLRGADNRHTVLLVDGMRVDSQSTGGPSWNAIPLSQIERIEVLKGPASALYGSDAVGGVVQIFTRKASQGWQAEIGAGAGNLGLRKADASVSGRSGMIDLAASVSTERSRGFNATLDLPGSYVFVPDTDGYRKHSSSLRVGLAPAEGHRVELSTLRSHLDAQFDLDAFSPTADDHALQDSDATRLAWNARWSPELSTEASAGESRDRYISTPSPYLANTRLRQLGFNAFWRLAPEQQLQLLAERREDSLFTHSAYSPDLNDQRSQTGLGLGWLYSAGPVNLQVHGRRDHDSQFGSVGTGSLAAGYALGAGWRVVASWGNAFRAPTLYQRGSEYGPQLGKPGAVALAPEHGRNAEAGLKYAVGDDELSLTTFRNRVSNLISFGAAGSCASPYGCYQNVASATLQGVSLRGATRVGAVNLAATADWQSPKNDATGKLLARRARQLATLRADAPLGDWQLGAAVQASGGRWDNAANTQRLGGYALLDLDAQWRLSPELRLQFNLQNALDHAVTLAQGYAPTPRQVFVGLRWAPQ